MRRATLAAALLALPLAAHAASRVVYEDPEDRAVSQRALDVLVRHCPAIRQANFAIDRIELSSHFALPGMPPWSRGWPTYLSVRIVLGGDVAQFLLGAGPHPGIASVTPDALDLCGDAFIPLPELRFLSAIRMPDLPRDGSLITTVPGDASNVK